MATLHPRTIIRAALRDYLSGKTDAGTQVFDAFNRPWPDDGNSVSTFYPALLVHDTEESLDDNAKNIPKCVRRKLTMDIYGVIASSIRDDTDAKLDTLSLQVEQAINKNITLDGKLDYSALTGTERAIEQGAQFLFGVVRLSYEMTYWTSTLQNIQPAGRMPFTIFNI